MISLSLKQLKEIVNGEFISISDEDCLIHSVSIDSRNIEPNSLFIALIGEKFDGHAFAKSCVESGAIAVLVSHQVDLDIPQILVADTHKALGQIAHWVRLQVKTKIVALTGSSGKTSVKEMTASILQQCGQTLFTKGNFNNDIGVPLTLLRLTEQDQFAVIELGANHIGEIAYTTRLVQPQTALINNISQAHLEGFGSLDGVAQAKSEIFLGLSKDGTAIINLMSYAENWFELLADKHIQTFAIEQLTHNRTADFYASDLQFGNTTNFVLHTPIGQCSVELPLIGLHNVANAIAASALAISVGASLEAVTLGLQKVKPVKGRLYPIKLNDDQLILDDSYNANVGSMIAAANVLSLQSGYRVFVAGDMAELGSSAEICHQQVGETLRELAIDCVVSVGTVSRLISEYSGVGHHFSNKMDAARFLCNLLINKEKIVILVKGSRSAKMEDVIDLINK